MTNIRMSFRMDFVLEDMKILDEKQRTVQFVFRPNPRRYEWKEIEGKRLLYDKLDNIYFSEEAFSGLAEQLAGTPIYYQPQGINDAVEYVKNRIPLIRTMLQGNGRQIEQAEWEDKSESFLQSLSENKLGFVIMSVDIAGSTKLSTKLEPNQFAKLISIVLYEMSEIIPEFHGHVLKYTGDGLIAYFPEPSFITKNDLAIDCALTVKRLVYDGLNPILESEGYPRLDIRIGLDSGEAVIITVGSQKTKRHKDIIGTVVSIAAKIQSLGRPGDILLGDVTERNLHTMWREICEEVELGEGWPYKTKDGKPYKVHRVKFGLALNRS